MKFLNFKKVAIALVLVLGFVCLGVLNRQEAYAETSFGVGVTCKEREFHMSSGTHINGAWPPWDLPKRVWITSCVSNNYEGAGAWSEHYVRCWLGDHVDDSERQKCKRIWDGFYAGWYKADAQSCGNVSSGTGYSFYGKNINDD